MEELHEEIERLIPEDRTRRMLAHALLALGVPLRCGITECACPDARDEFEVDGPKRLSFDHTVPVADGGADTPDNVRFAHLGCNLASRNYRRRLVRAELEMPDGFAADSFNHLEPFLQELVTRQHGTVDEASRWTFDSGIAIEVIDSP